MAAASSRILSSASIHSHLKNTRFQFPFHNRQHLRSPRRASSLSLHSRNHSFFKFPCDPSSGSLPSFSPAQFSVSGDCLDRLCFGPKDDSFHWHFAPGQISYDRSSGILYDDNGPEVTVVVLGWLGAKTKHLRRYVEMYNSKGIHAVTFVASVADVLWFDLGRRLEERIERLAKELVKWLSNEDGQERCLMFHTFSNTGWLAYGAILNDLKDRRDLFHKIKGCVVDSGGDPNLDPKVWAAGFTTALLKKTSSAAYPPIEKSIGSMPNGLKMETEEASLIEGLMLSAFERLFSYILNQPFAKEKLTEIISCLSTNQPPCPQLYLYSTGDKVIPFQAIESFIDDQRRAGKEVNSFNFGPSPHVDHYRTFPEVYTSQLDVFLKKCLSTVGTHN